MQYVCFYCYIFCNEWRKNRVNVYDFDGTIYDGDSSVDIYIFLLKRHPNLIVYFPKQLFGIIKYKLHLCTKEEMKGLYFSFLRSVHTDKTFLEDFWKQNQKKIKGWYLSQKRDDDVIISASPEFLLRPVCKTMGIKNLIASRVDFVTGKFLSKNCHGIEKVIRFKEVFPEVDIDNFYSDSKSDECMAKLASKAFLIKRDRIKAWDWG